MKFYFGSFTKAKTISDNYTLLSISTMTSKKFNGIIFIPFIPSKSLLEDYYIDKKEFIEKYKETVLGKFTLDKLIESFRDAEIEKPLFISNGVDEDIVIRDCIMEWIQSADGEVEEI